MIQLDAMMFIIHLLLDEGGLFTLESPWNSVVWDSPQFVHLCGHAYGLVSPGISSWHFARIAANFPEIMSLVRNCPDCYTGRHEYISAWGSARVDGKTVSRAKAAGNYPMALCSAVASSVTLALATRVST